MSKERFNLTIRISNVDDPGVYTEVLHESCDPQALEAAPIVCSVLEQHLYLREQGIKHLEVVV